ncbi:MAG: 1-acyl-sn-glycerol-3-phosphate acyltransferase [Rickettsiales bacterium]|nr:1-acyl-sn-glycerol-3-phosphate acyltransferase [Rickettsiales bacterium]
MALSMVSRLKTCLSSLSLEPFYRFGARWMIRTFYNIDYRHFEECLKHKGAKLLICNHVAYVDGLIINAAMNCKVRYIIDKNIYRLPVINYFMRLNRAIPIAATRKDVENALNLISEGLKQGDTICIFPEGQMTYTGHLGRFRPGIEWIIDRDPVPVFPLALRGLWGSIFSRKYRKSRFRFIPKKFRPKIICVCGDMIQPEDAKVDVLQKVVMELRKSIDQPKT